MTRWFRLAASATGPLQQAARASLAQLSRGDVNGALVQDLDGSETKTRTEAIRALATRRASSAANDLLECSIPTRIFAGKRFGRWER